MMDGRLARIINHRYLAVGLAVVCLIAGIANFQLVGRKFKSVVKFLPSSALSGESGSSMFGSLGKVASQLGFDIGGGGAIDPSYIFPEIVYSQRMGNYLLGKKLPLELGGTMSLLELVSGNGPYTDLDRENAIRRLHKNNINMSFDKKNGVSTLSVVLSDRIASVSLALTIVTEVDSFYSQSKRTVAEDRLRFISERLSLTAKTLEDNENELKRFRESNRQKSDSPQLELEEARLIRKVGIQQEVFTTLKSQEVMIGIQSASSVSQITIVDGPTHPQRRVYPTVGKMGLKWLAIFLGSWSVAMVARERMHRKKFGSS